MTYVKPNPFVDKKAKTPRDTKRDSHIEFLFGQIDDWFFNNDTTYFDPTYLESIEAWWDEYGFLTDSQYEGLENIYQKFVCTN